MGLFFGAAAFDSAESWRAMLERRLASALPPLLLLFVGLESCVVGGRSTERKATGDMSASLSAEMAAD